MTATALLAAGGIEIAALHKHLPRARPATVYMRSRGLGDPVKLATVLRDDLVLSKTLPAIPPPSATLPVGA
jgi:hypothetical protein